MVWIKQNKLSTLLLLVVVLLAAKVFLPSPSPTTSLPARVSLENMAEKASFGGEALAPMADEIAPQPEAAERLVIKESSVSLLVKDVSGTQTKIVDFAENAGGYMVNMSTFSPEDGDTGSISVRVPSAKLDETLEYLRSLAVRVVSTNISGRDVTDQYVDIEAHLQSLLDTKAKLEEIMAQAVAVNDIMNVQRQIMSLQYQIDNLRGQKDYLEKSAETSLIAVSLATDELSLPYNPANPWRPEVVFKTAVRQLMLTLRGVGSLVIWLAVYSVIWLPILLGIIFAPRILKNRFNFKNPKSNIQKILD